MNMRYYAGIGSRETPEDVQDLMAAIAVVAARQGMILRSGAAEGADSAFEKGADAIRGPKEIFLPWNNFNGRHGGERWVEVGVCERSLEIAKEYHPNWSALREGGRKLMARNVYQILGSDLQSPVELVICWTKNGNGRGGTGQALRIARDMNIPIHDLGKPEVLAAYMRRIDKERGR